MKIETIETFLGEGVGVVRVRTDDGLEGIGQTAPFYAEDTVSVLHSMIAPFFLGQDPWDLEALISKCLRKNYKVAGSFIYRALAGVDTAIWDILAKAAGQPVYKLIGGAYRSSVPMYASSMSRFITPEQEADRLLRLAENDGFRAAKIRISSVMGNDVDAAPGRTERIIPYIRNAMGDDFDISADANGGFSSGRAIRIGRLLEENRYYHYEEPCPFDDLERTAEVAATLDIPIAGGEQDNSLRRFKQMIDERVVDIVQPDIGYIGGISRARKVAMFAELAGIPCTPHCSNNSLLQVFTLHLAAAMPACSQFQEWGIEERGSTGNFVPRGIYDPLLTVVDGEVALPTAPGWGVEILQPFLKDAVHRASGARDAVKVG